jgi:beta-lactamase superfamily II metal-dependent hydrolase
MANNQLDPPSKEEIEISLFGPGYGEAIALHFGAGKWLLVDSCLDPDKQPASLHYLDELKVDLKNDVKLIAVTHWHDDHIRGVSTIFNICESATIVIPSALNANEFLELASLYDQSITKSTSGLSEFTKVLRIARTREKANINSPKLALADKVIFKDTLNLDATTPEAKVSSLSPSDASTLKAYQAFAQLLKEAGPGKRVTPITPNHTSVALWIEIGPHKILLGADLEVTTDSKTGWSVIINESTIISGKASVFKIPHHGSENAHHKRTWSELLSAEPFAILTPFRRGHKPLPTHKDVVRICNLTHQAYITAPPRRRRQKWRQRIVRDFVKDMTKYTQDVHSGWGHIRLRNKIHQTSQPWQVELFDDAYALINDL